MQHRLASQPGFVQVMIALSDSKIMGFVTNPGVSLSYLVSTYVFPVYFHVFETVLASQHLLYWE